MNNSYHETFNFSVALEKLKQGFRLSRLQFKNTCYIEMGVPNPKGLSTLPYLIMIKGKDRFPIDLSCESIFATDWYVQE